MVMTSLVTEGLNDSLCCLYVCLCVCIGARKHHVFGDHLPLDGKVKTGFSDGLSISDFSNNLLINVLWYQVYFYNFPNLL